MKVQAWEADELEHFCDALEVSYSSFAVEGVV
jgi:hypothetical protein